MRALWETDIASARAVLEKHGLTAERAVAYVRDNGIGWIDFAPGTPDFLRDPTHPACHALRLLLLDKHIAGADPNSLQVGRLWGFANLGLEFPAIARSMQAWRLNRVRGPGGRKENDLTRTLRMVLREMPSAGWQDVVAYLQSDDALDRYGRLENPDLHVTDVEFDKRKEVLVYRDRSGFTQKIKIESLIRKIRALR